MAAFHEPGVNGAISPPPSSSVGVQGVAGPHTTGHETDSDSAITCPKFSPAVGISMTS